MDVGSMTISQMQALQEELAQRVAQREAQHEAQNVAPHPYPLGEAVLIRTVTMFYTGRVASVSAQEIVLTEAAWIADTGRFSNALTSGELSEVEPYPDGDVIIGRGGIMDCCLWAHPLPRTVK